MKLTQKDITGAVARELREQSGLSQAAFWKPLGVKQSVGCRYEAANTIPQAVRILLVAHYVSGVKIDAATHEGVAELSRLGAIQSKQAHAKALTSGVRTDLARAIKSLKNAHDALDSI